MTSSGSTLLDATSEKEVAREGTTTIPQENINRDTKARHIAEVKEDTTTIK